MSLAEGIADDEYLRALEELLPQVWEFAPNFLFYQAGADPLHTDALGKLKLTHQGLIRRDQTVMKAVRARHLPFVITMGGGYSKPIENTALAHANTFRAAAEVFGA